MSATVLHRFWPDSALIKHKYIPVREKSTTTPDQIKRDQDFAAALQTLHAILEFNQLEYKGFGQTVHQIYNIIIRDETKVFALFEHDVILLLARVDISHVPSPNTADFVGIFDCLLSEITKRYDDYTEEFEYLLHRTSKTMGLFLISCLNFSTLLSDKLEKVSSFALKLTQYYLTLTELVEYWFTTALKDPDMMFLVTRKNLPPDCFPIYELAKNFLYMEELLSKPAKDTLLHVILISSFSSGLEKWILKSDLPILLLSGLLSNFNQVCYSDQLLSHPGLNLGELALTSTNFREFDDFIKFVMDLISYSSHDSIRVALLNGFHTKFVIPLTEYFQSECLYQINALVLFTYTFECLVLPQDPNHLSNSLVVDFLLEHYFLPNGELSNILDLYATTLLEWRDSPTALVPVFKLISILSRADSPDLLCATLFTQPANTMTVLQNQHIGPLAAKLKLLVSCYRELSELLVSCLDITYKRLSCHLSTVITSKKLLLFDPRQVLSSIVCVEVFGFFNHSTATNEHLVWMIMDLICANSGLFTNLLCECESEYNDDGGLFFEILDYLWCCYTNYEQKLGQGLDLIHRQRPSPLLMDKLKDLGPVLQQRLSVQEQISKDVLNVHHVGPNVELFRVLMVRLYATQRAIFTLFKVKYQVL